MIDTTQIFNISTEKEFESMAIDVFRFQLRNNSVYKEFCHYLDKTESNVKELKQIPFLPIDFFKSKKVVATKDQEQIVFSSSGTTGQVTSKHYVTQLKLYGQSFTKGFDHFYGDVSQYCILALLPSYLERSGSSLIYMVNDLIEKSNHADSGFYLKEIDALVETLTRLDNQGVKTLLIGVSFALLDVVEEHTLQLNNTLVMETGGMKGRRKELIREELHDILKKGFGVSEIHSEYGMTELLSQAYSKGNGIFKTPPWMKVLIRDTEDPLSYLPDGKTGGINVIDLANINSCSFIATQDLGKKSKDRSFEILGRFDHSDIRGCNLMVM
ncbi:acyl transferase [Maribacter polysiphoniae]|uniref:Acyl transferase n=1 Tax=Maribacter polysiphoniae TaxID=429344 RepID=A0A316E5A9_9FLAO|nr:acyl transferase [Maribacter polysiphoniae]MBD1260413.1 acyl transferase [Maribacter polysiphoniae]PWK25877.1 acyl-protein synthetase LuxE [Maribacter polysiphoniae]